MEQQVLDAIVVGAGPSGLVAARRLAEAGVSFAVIERHHDVGGIWNIEAPGSPMYESAHFISSKTTSGFPDYPMPDHFPDYPSHRQIHQYISAYADAFDLRRHVRFGRSVVRAIRHDAGWELTLDDGSRLQSRYLVCAVGVTWEPNRVSWPGDFSGEVMHSVEYRSASQLTDKRVLVVGAGNSGVDIACDAAFAASAAYLSVRRGYHFVPKHIMGIPTDVFSSEGPKLPHRLEQAVLGVLVRLINGDLRKYGLPKPDHRVLASHPIMNTQILHYLGHGDCVAKPDVARFDGDQVVFTDGSREKVDLVITATGYEHRVPFLENRLLPDKGGRPDLYLGMFPRNEPTLAVLGFVEFASAAYTNFDQMSQIVVADITATAGSRARAAIDKLKRSHRPDLSGGHRYVDSKRHANYIDVHTLHQVLADVRQQIGMTEPA